MKKTLTCLASAATLGAVPVTTLAATPEAYLGGNLGYYRFEQEEFPNSSDEFEDERGSWKAYVGVRPNDVLGFEAGYVEFGEVDHNGARFDSDGLQVAMTAGVPFTPNFSVYGKLGQLFWDRKTRFTNFTGDSRDGDDTFYGVGTRIGVASNLDLRLEYERYEIDRADVDMASLGLNLMF